MVRIKVCGMLDSLNMNEIAALKPDYMGFIFYPHSKRYYNNDFALIKELPGSIEKVGVFVNEEPGNILQIAKLCDLNVIQLHGSENHAFCSKIRSSGYQVIKAFSIDNSFDFSALREFHDSCDYFMFDTKSYGYGGSGRKFNWELLINYTADVPFFLSGGIGHQDAELIRNFDNPFLYAVDINSRFEARPGVKDIRLVKTFIMNIRQSN